MGHQCPSISLERSLLDADDAPDLVGLEAQRHRAAYARQRDHVVELVDHALEAQPVHRVAGAQVDHLHAAVRRGLARLQRFVQRQAREGLVVARLGRADQRKVTMIGVPWPQIQRFLK